MVLLRSVRRFLFSSFQKRAGVGVPGSPDSITCYNHTTCHCEAALFRQSSPLALRGLLFKPCPACASAAGRGEFVERCARNDTGNAVIQPSRLAYRSRQFFSALLAPKISVPDDFLRQVLTPAQIALFRRLQTSEQAHAAQVLQRLRDDGQADPDLLTAALLHDVGKVLHPLVPLERVLIVLGRRFFPRLVSRLGSEEPRGLHRAFVVAAHHAAWGADLAAQAGTSVRACDLIRNHQEPVDSGDPLRLALQAADDEN